MSEFSNWWPAPAKLNLFLHLTAKRSDGYHNLQTIFQITDFCDHLFFEITDDRPIIRTTQMDFPAHEDLCVRAAELLQKTARCKSGVKISLRKNIPTGGGLGGGSSDAATTLVALNHLWNLQLPVQTLIELGASLGADVPVFVRGESAWGEGIGEQLCAVDIPQVWYVVIHPPIHISTAALFAAPELTRDAPAITIRDYLAGRSKNVFEPLVFNRYPSVAKAAEWLSLNTQGPARLTGTGSCVFAEVESAERGREVIAEFKRVKNDQFGQNWQAYCMQGRRQSPLLEKLQQLND